tara:strand:+ start:148 stop:714 length:567 start_codon:yes stop_codon:yes gene_type:complete
MKLLTDINTIFLDRDGVINKDSGYITNWSDFIFIEGVLDALIHLTKLDYKLVIVTNQSAIARGFFTTEDFINLNKKMINEFNTFGIKLTDVFFCPHHKDGVIEEYSMECNFRKPNPGMLFSAAEKHNIELSRSIIVGDKESDLLAGRNANLHSCYLIRSSNSESPSESIYAKKSFNSLNDFVFNFLCK